jgi:protein SCO1/2
MRTALLGSAILALGVLLAWLLWSWEPARTPAGASAGASAGQGLAVSAGQGQRPMALAPVPTGGDFTLSSWEGRVDTRDLRGSVALIYFGYTWCPDVCPTNLAFIANALKMLSSQELEEVRVLFVGVDPDRDTPERLKEYAGYFHIRVLGVTGTPEELAAVAGLYGAAYRRADGAGSAMGYMVDHSAYSYVLTPAGHLVRTLDHATAPAKILAATRASRVGS